MGLKQEIEKMVAAGKKEAAAGMELEYVRESLDSLANNPPKTDFLDDFLLSITAMLLWRTLPPGVQTLRFANNMVLHRPRKETDQINGATWTLDDLNIYYQRYFSSTKLTWERVEVAPQKKLM